MKPVVVGLLAEKGSGKTTVAEYLIKNYGFRRIAFADPVKAFAAHLYGFKHEQLYGTQAQKEAVDPTIGMSGRDAMRLIGEGARNFIHEDIWCWKLAKTIEASDHKYWIVDDVRRTNEAKSLVSNPHIDGKIVRIFSPEEDHSDPHPSEREIREVPAELIDFALISRRSEGLSDLFDQVENMMMGSPIFSDSVVYKLWQKKLEILHESVRS